MLKLARGDKGPEVKQLQRALNRLGSMLLVDGDFGSSTELALLDARALLPLPPLTGAADDALMAALTALPEPSKHIPGAGVTLLGREAGVTDKPASDRRREMKQIQVLLAANQPDSVAAQIRAMKRLWQSGAAQGLIDRREREARLWTDGFAALQLE